MFPALFLGVFREATTDFTVDARALTQTGGDHIKTLISNPSGSRTDALITDLGDGTYNVEYTPYEEGEFKSNSVCRIRWLIIRSSISCVLIGTHIVCILQAHTVWRFATRDPQCLKVHSVLPSLKAVIQLVFVSMVLA